jgi:hypothetical protein
VTADGSLVDRVGLRRDLKVRSVSFETLATFERGEWLTSAGRLASLFLSFFSQGIGRSIALPPPTKWNTSFVIWPSSKASTT